MGPCLSEGPLSALGVSHTYKKPCKNSQSKNKSLRLQFKTPFCPVLSYFLYNSMSMKFEDSSAEATNVLKRE